VWRQDFFGLKQCGDIGDTHPGFNVVGDDFMVADDGGLNFPGFDGMAWPHPRSSGSKDGFASFLKILPQSNCFGRQRIGACDDCLGF
jgi:hypothetical protein